MTYLSVPQVKGTTLEYALLLLLVLAIAALLVPVARLVGRRLRRARGRTLALLLAATVAALALRLELEPFRPFVFFDEWDYSEGARFLLLHRTARLCAYGDVADCRVAWNADHPSGYPMLVALASALAGPLGYAHNVSLALGVLSVPLAFSAGLYLLPSEGAALASAALLALLPLHVRYSTTASSESASAFMVILVVLLAAVERKERTRSSRWAMALSLALAASVRPENLLLALPVIALNADRAYAMALPAAAALGLAALAAPTFMPYFGGSTQANAAQLAMWWWGEGRHSPVLLLAALFGLAELRAGPRRLLLGWFALVFALFSVQQTPLEGFAQDRHLLPGYVSFVLLAGAGADALRREGAWLWVPMALLFALQTAPLYGQCPDCARPEVRELALVCGARATVGERCIVAAAVPHFVTGAMGRRVVHVSLQDELRREVEGGGCVLFLEDAMCLEHFQYPEPWRDWCGQLRERYELRLVAELPEEGPRIALYRVVGPRGA